jgi:DNA-binding IclR family transcriptional regulator
MAGGSKGEGRSVTGKVIAIMCAFVHGDELSNLEISRLSGLPISTTHRLVAQLVLGGMLERTAKKHYRIGPNVRAIADPRQPARSTRDPGVALPDPP